MWARVSFFVLVMALGSCGSSESPSDVIADSFVKADVGEDVPVADPGGSVLLDGVEETTDPGEAGQQDVREDNPEDAGREDADDTTDTEVGDPCGGCTGGMVCVGDQCQCPESLTDCFGVCKPLGTKTDCSECGDACPQGGSCEAGQCQCPGTQVDCSGVCTSLGTDTDCSDCGDACIGVKTCELGKCMAPVDPECLPTVPCVSNDDCPIGARCNQAIQPPACQKLYCGSFGSACSDEWFCLSQKCQDEECVSDCSGLECGPDPIYGESCGTCQEGAACVSNQCVCRPEDHLECVAGNVTWIDSCGNVGAVKEGCPLACLAGECVGCEAVGKVNCSGICTHLGTNTDCSECGDACPQGGSCEAGQCKCPGTQVDCSGVCTTLGTNNDCSDCDDACSQGRSCEAGQCQCPENQVDCSGWCTPLGTNTDCSDCGDACSQGRSCEAGQCQCPENQVDCFGVCKPLGTATDCSDCGDACTEGLLCEDSECVPFSMVTVSAGPFMQGCNEAVDTECGSNEKPYHKVNVPEFEIDKYEVTVGLYGDCVTGGGCTASTGTSSYCNWGKAGKGAHPMNCITWDQARAYCAWAGKRLCSESEWEKASRGTDGRKYPWGNEAATCEYAVMEEGGNGCGIGSTWPVGSKPAGASPYGALDMSGNVWEWVEDDYHTSYGAAPTNGSAWVDDPRASPRVVRGGSFVDVPRALRASARSYVYPYSAAYYLGLRCCRSK